MNRTTNITVRFVNDNQFLTTDMTTTIEYNPTNDKRPYRNIRLCISNDVLLAALDEYERKTGKDLDEIAKEAIVSYLEEKEQIRLK